MLKQDDRKKFIVFPSWIEPAYTWEEVPNILKDPLHHDEFSLRTYGAHGLRKLGYPDIPQKAEVVDGPEGGGLIIVEKSKGEPWLGYGALTFDKGVDILVPGPMVGMKCNVSYLEPTTYSGWWLDKGRRRKSYDVGVSAEHVESALDSIFWAVGFKTVTSGKEINGLNEVCAWGGHFGLCVKRLPEFPNQLRDEVAVWMSKELEYVWFAVEGGGNSFGFHFAVMLYVALQLAYVAGKRLWCMHLLTTIEGEPRAFSKRKIDNRVTDR